MTAEVNAVCTSCFHILHIFGRSSNSYLRTPNGPSDNHQQAGLRQHSLCWNHHTTPTQTPGHSEHRCKPHTRPPTKLYGLTIHKNSQFKLLTHTYKDLYNTGPEYLKSQLHFHYPTTHLHSALLSLAHIPCIHKSKTGVFSFSYITPKTWNNFPQHMRAFSSLLRLHKKLRTWLFAEAPWGSTHQPKCLDTLSGDYCAV